VAKTDGVAQFTMDVSLPDMLTALIARPSRFGAKVRSFDASAARQVEGVTDVVQVEAGVAVLAHGFWAARKGRDALSIDWDESGAERRGRCTSVPAAAARPTRSTRTSMPSP